MTLSHSLSHILRTRNLAALLAATWGYMLGGSLLMVGVTVLIGSLHSGLIAAALLDVLFGSLILGVYGFVSKRAYQSVHIRGLLPVLWLFISSLLISAFMPFTILWAFYEAWRGANLALIEKDGVPEHRGVQTSFTAQIGRFYGRMAHIL